jgi:hypothetical protein
MGWSTLSSARSSGHARVDPILVILLLAQRVTVGAAWNRLTHVSRFPGTTDDAVRYRWQWRPYVKADSSPNTAWLVQPDKAQDTFDLVNLRSHVTPQHPTDVRKSSHSPDTLHTP